MNCLDLTKSEILYALQQARAEKTIVHHHPLGFLRIHLTDQSRLREGLYLHVWPGTPLASQPRAFRIHRHIFDLRSRVICGSLVDCLYAVDEVSEGDFMVFEARHFADGSTLVPVNRNARCIEKERRIVQAGMEYDIPRGTYHSTERTEGYTATLMLKTNIVPDMKPQHVSREHIGEVSCDFPRIDHDTAWTHVFQLEQRIP